MIKLQIILLPIIIASTLLTGAVNADTYSPDYMEQIVAAISEGDIDKAKSLNEQRNEKIDAMELDAVKIDIDELDLLSKIVHLEAGCSWLTEEHRRLVASVAINRVASPEFPNTIKEVLEQPGQYWGDYINGVTPWLWCVESALYVLEHGSVAPESVVFQSEGKQGSGVYKAIYDETLGSTTYFCFSSRPELYEN